jgi:hypothetical protein
MESQIITQTTAKEGPSQRPPRAIVIDPSHTVPPMPLNSQLAWVWYAERLTPSTLGLKAKVSTDTILRIEYGGKGTLASFCKVMVALERRIDIRTWEYRQLLSPEDTSDPEALCPDAGSVRNARAAGDRFARDLVIYVHVILHLHERVRDGLGVSSRSGLVTGFGAGLPIQALLECFAPQHALGVSS